MAELEVHEMKWCKKFTVVDVAHESGYNVVLSTHTSRRAAEKALEEAQ